MRHAALSKPLIPHDHPWVVRTEGVCGGRPRIRESRIPVSVLAELHRQGEPVEEILATYPQLGAEAVQDALAYYLDHQEEIDAEIAAGTLESVLAQTDAELGPDGVIRFKSRPR